MGQDKSKLAKHNSNVNIIAKFNKKLAIISIDASQEQPILIGIAFVRPSIITFIRQKSRSLRVPSNIIKSKRNR